MMYLAVVPKYRRECFDSLRAALPELVIACSRAHLDPTVQTGLRDDEYIEVRMWRLFGRAFVQVGEWRRAFTADNLIVDLNPRSLTAWALLVARRLAGRRSIVWGHLYPQAGATASTKGLRHIMRRLAGATVTYTYDNEAMARRDLPGQPVWVAPNSLYPTADLLRPLATGLPRNDVVYVGRFEPAKKVDLLVRAFAESDLSREGARLVLVGDGSEREHLKQLVQQIGVADVVHFAGWVDGFDALADIYGRAFVSGSPGFAGLGLTQSLGFGVPMVVARNEPHSPEIELASTGGVIWAESDDSASHASGLRAAWFDRSQARREDLRDFVSRRYSAEAMAGGLARALTSKQEATIDA